VARRALSRAKVLRAQRLEAAGLTEQAREELESAGGLDADPEISAAALSKLGRDLAEKGEWEQAESTLRAVLELYSNQPAAPVAAYNFAALLEQRIKREDRNPTTEEHEEIAAAYLWAGEEHPESPESRSALVAAAEHFREVGDHEDELKSLRLLLRHHAQNSAVRALLARASRRAWREGRARQAHELYLDITKRAPRSREAVAAFVYLADEAKRQNDLAEARWGWTMAVRAQKSLESNGQPGDPAMAQQAALSLADQKKAAFEERRLQRPVSEIAAQLEDMRAGGKEIVDEYAVVARAGTVAGVRALLGIAAIERAMAHAIQFQPQPEGIAPESLAVRTQDAALESWAHRKAAIDALILAYDSAINLDSRADTSMVEDELDPFGLAVDALRSGESLDRDQFVQLAEEAAQGIMREYDLAIIAHDDLIRTFAELPNRGETPLLRATYRLALIEDFLRPRIRFLTELKLEALQAARKLERTSSFTSSIFSHLLTPRGAASESIKQMEITIPSLLDRYDELVEARSGGEVDSVLTIEELPAIMFDHQDLAIRLAVLDVEIVREQLEVVSGEPNLSETSLDRARRVMEVALEHAAEMERHARRSRKAAERNSEQYEQERHVVLREAVQQHEDLAATWERGAMMVLEPAWAIAAQLGLRPQPQTDRIARELARRDPAGYAYVLGLKEVGREVVTGEGWTWGVTEQEAEERPVDVSHSLNWDGDLQSPALVSGDPLARTVWFRGSFRIDGTISGADLQIVASRHYEVYLNGRFAAEALQQPDVDRGPEIWQVADLLRQGENILLVRLSGEGKGSELGLRVLLKTVEKIDNTMHAVFPESQGGW
jgi:tetratricopeptide (TPR) repeat protein